MLPNSRKETKTLRKTHCSHWSGDNLVGLYSYHTLAIFMYDPCSYHTVWL
uniref:Uncharacterized protein n=1 Tax=Arundo donax TaxID=35708 RepID=A0A0A9HIX6_ARUDO